jgi:hypothetical protein
MMKFYLAAASVKADDMERHRDALQKRGHQVVSTWHTQGDLTLDLESPFMKTEALRDLKEVAQADALLSFTGGGRGGRHYEAGHAHALGVSVWLVGEPEHVFHSLANRRFKDWAYVVQFVETLL